MTFTKSKLTATIVLAAGWMSTRAGVAQAKATIPPAFPVTAAARIAGETGDLTIRNGVLAGRLAGGEYRAVVHADGARGSGPRGVIDVKLRRVDQGYEVSGIWNGGEVHFVVDENGVQGNAVRPVGTGDTGYGRCRFRLNRMGNGHNYAGPVQCLGTERAGRLEVRPQASADLTDAQNVILLVAYLAGPGARGGI